MLQCPLLCLSLQCEPAASRFARDIRGGLTEHQHVARGQGEYRLAAVTQRIGVKAGARGHLA